MCRSLDFARDDNFPSEISAGIATPARGLVRDDRIIGSKKRTQAYGFSSGLCALTWRFSAGTSYFGQPQHTVRIQKIQPCSCRPPPCLNSTGIISHFFPFVYPPDFVHKLFTIFISLPQILRHSLHAQCNIQHPRNDFAANIALRDCLSCGNLLY